MKLIKSRTGRVDAGKRSRPPLLRNGLLACALSGLALFAAPLVESTAGAQPASKEAASQPATLHRVRGKKGQITDGTNSPEVYIVSREANVLPVVEVEGPSTLTVRVYPAVSRDWFGQENKEVPRPVIYKLGPSDGDAKEQVFPGNTRRSPFISTDIDAQSSLAIGTPIEMSIQIPSGMHKFSVVSPNGFLEVVRVERIEERKPQPPPQKPRTKPAAPAVTEVPWRPPVFKLNGVMLPFHEIGPSKNSGNMSNATALGRIRLGKHLALLAGGGFSSWDLSISTPDATTIARSYTGRLVTGLSYASNRHRIYALVSGGYTKVLTDISSKTDSRREDVMTQLFDYRGELGYGYGRWARLSVSGGSDPFNPLSVHISGVLPYGWTPEAYPWAELSLMWLHTLTPAEGEGLGAVRVSDNNIHTHLLLGVPVWRIGPLVPSVFLAGELSASGDGLQNANFMVGGALSADFKGFGIEVAGAVSPLNELQLFMLRARYSR